MKHLTTAFACSLALLSSASFAKETPATGASAPMSKQQSKMGSCNADAGDKKGDDRKAFMKTCLSAKAPDAAPTQQTKMKTCNVDAAGKKGDERKAFMKECLSK